MNTLVGYFQKNSINRTLRKQFSVVVNILQTEKKDDLESPNHSAWSFF